jgi:hypothetical protein
MAKRLLLTASLLLGTAVPVAAQGLGSSTKLLGFTDFNYLVTNRDQPSGFREGQLVMHLASSLTEQLNFFTEASATASSAAFRVEVERVILRYELSDLLKLGMGRFHTHFGYWNTAYHHGQWFQTATARPEMIRGGGTFLPVHFVGVVAEGGLPSNSLGLAYAAGIGNGRGDVATRAGDAGELDPKPSYTLQLTSNPAAVRGLQIGASLYVDEPVIGENTRVQERAVGVHVALERERRELIAEYAWTRRTPADSAAFPGSGWYVQGAHRLPGSLSAVKPYARLEAVAMEAGDPFQRSGLDYRAVNGGIRYDFAAVAALKAEYRRERINGQRFRSLALQVSYMFPGQHDDHVVTTAEGAGR